MTRVSLFLFVALKKNTEDEYEGDYKQLRPAMTT